MPRSHRFHRYRREDPPLVAVAVYDALFAKIFHEAGADALLVGDSLAMVIGGARDTLSVSAEQMAYHARAVRRGAEGAHIIVDVPFGLTLANEGDAAERIGALLRDADADAVKIEASQRQLGLIARLADAGVAVMAHIGLRPQYVRSLGSYRRFGANEEEQAQVISDGVALAEAGATSLLLENTAAQIASELRKALSVPLIGIGAGTDCDGQILVGHDLLGLTEGPTPPFVQRFAALREMAVQGANAYVEAIQQGRFPSATPPPASDA